MDENGVLETSTVKMDLLFDAQFELSSLMTEHTHRVFSLIDLLAQLGGLFSSVVGIVYIVASMLNRRLLLHKIASAIYFIKSNHTQGHSPKPEEQKIHS